MIIALTKWTFHLSLFTSPPPHPNFNDHILIILTQTPSKKRPPILVIRGQGWLFWLCYSMLIILGYLWGMSI